MTAKKKNMGGYWGDFLICLNEVKKATHLLKIIEESDKAIVHQTHEGVFLLDKIKDDVDYIKKHLSLGIAKDLSYAATRLKELMGETNKEGNQ